MVKSPRPSVALLAAFLLLPLRLAAAEPQAASGASEAPPTAAVTAITGKITIDGQLDEPEWQSAPKLARLVQRQPNPGQAPTERTEVTLLHDADYLYIGVLALDSEPGRVIGTQMSRDATLGSDDRIEVLLDTFLDQRNAFYFATNPSGALVDGLLSSEQLNTNWDAIWQVRTRRTDRGWIAEFAIPFKSLSFPEDRTSWGFNLSRSVYRKLEEIRWSGARLETPFNQVSEAGQITNLVGLKQGIGLDVRPYVAGHWLNRRSTAGSDYAKGHTGLDVFYNITPSLKLTGTLNTDFGETEVDARQINLSRFSVLLPEKRSFFLEDAGVFNFASIGPTPAGGIASTGADIYPFFSRQIGLLAGQEVPIDGGLKLTGKTGRTDLGLLAVQTGDTSFVEGKTFLIGRVRQNLFEQSYVGAIFTDGHPGARQSGQTYGADFRLATSHFLGEKRNFVVDGYALRSANRGVSDDDVSWGFSARYPNDKFDTQFVVREMPRNFRPGLGFVQRSNVRMYRGAVSFNPRPDDFLNIQQMFHDVYYTRFERADTGQLESSDLYITPLDWHFKSGDSVHAVFDPNWIYERLFSNFEIAPGVVLRPGEYRFTRYKASIASASKRRLSGSVNLNWGDYWSGSAEQVSTSLTYKLPPWFTFTLSANQTFARLPEGDFTARIYTSTVNYSFSPQLSLSNLIQFDNRSRNLGWQGRLRWTPVPGRDLFLVFSQGWLKDPTGSGRFTPQDSKLSTKLQYTFRF